MSTLTKAEYEHRVLNALQAQLATAPSLIASVITCGALCILAPSTLFDLYNRDTEAFNALLGSASLNEREIAWIIDDAIHSAWKL